MTGIQRRDAELLDELRAQGVPPETLGRLRTTFEELQEMYDALDEPKVAWVIPISYARKVHEFLYRNMPGGYQAHTDELQSQIRKAATP